MSGLAIVGFGCLGLIVIAFLGGGILVAKFMPKLKEMAGDFEKDPAKTTTLMALKMNPDVEILKTDDAKREVTFKTKADGKTTTISFDEFEKGKITIKNDKGEEYSMDASKAQTDGVVLKSPEGKTVMGGTAAATAPPAEVPQYPGLTMDDGGFRSERAEAISGLAVGHVNDSVTKIKEHYEAALKSAGLEVQTILQEDQKTATVSGTQGNGKTSINVIIAADDSTPGKVQVTTQYTLPKP